MVHRRPSERIPYRVQGTQVVDGILKWVVSDVDTAKYGTGYAEFRAAQDGALVKSKLVVTNIDKAIEGELGPVPDSATQIWINRLEATAARA